jgi:hypothetical protein
MQLILLRDSGVRRDGYSVQVGMLGMYYMFRVKLICENILFGLSFSPPCPSSGVGLLRIPKKSSEEERTKRSAKYVPLEYACVTYKKSVCPSSPLTRGTPLLVAI